MMVLFPLLWQRRSQPKKTIQPMGFGFPHGPCSKERMESERELPSWGWWGGRCVAEICCEALIHLRVQENSVKKSANAVLKVHEDSVLHLINTYDFHIHVSIVSFSSVNVSPMPNHGIPPLQGVPD
jgi:hypothetical protein